MSKALTPTEIQFLDKVIKLSKSKDTYWLTWNDPKTVKRILKLMNKYGKNKVFKTIDILKKHDEMHTTMKRIHT